MGGLVETVPGVNASLLKTDNYKMDMKKDPLFRGEFEVVKELLAALKDGVGAKNNADKIIVFAGYMREASAAAREAIAADKKDSVALPSSGKCSIPAKELTIGKSFVEFMSDNSSLRAMVDTGKGNLQWERDIPPAALSNLENLAKSNFKGNLGQTIHDIYQTAHQMFSDMPQGDHKKRAKYRFASKPLMRILPADVKGEIEGLIEKKAISH